MASSPSAGADSCPPTTRYQRSAVPVPGCVVQTIATCGSTTAQSVATNADGSGMASFVYLSGAIVKTRAPSTCAYPLRGMVHNDTPNNSDGRVVVSEVESLNSDHLAPHSLKFLRDRAIARQKHAETAWGGKGKRGRLARLSIHNNLQL